MLNKEKTANWARLKYLLAVPLGLGLLCASTLGFSKSYSYLEIGQQKVGAEQTPQKVLDETDLAKRGFYSPSYIFDEKGNYKSLEKRLIIINGVAVKDNNKYYGSSNAEKIIFLKSKEAEAKYGSKAKNGAVEVYGKKSILTAPYVIADTAKFPAPKMQPSGKPVLSPKPPKVKKDQVKFPPPIVKPDKKAGSPKSVDDIELTEKTTNTKSKASQNQLNNKINKVILAEINKSRREPGFKERVKEQIKTGTLKKDMQEITPAIETFQKTNNVFNKAWTLYKPKVEENKNDNC